MTIRKAWPYALVASLALGLAWEMWSFGSFSWRRARQMLASPWRDDGPANAELGAFAAALRAGMTEPEVEALARGFGTLAVSRPAVGVLRVATPARLDWANRVAWIDFAPQIVSARFGTADSLGPIAEMPDLPPSRCFVDERTCRLVWMRQANAQPAPTAIPEPR